jgi:hypoxanthine phosphoribosyltransferase
MSESRVKRILDWNEIGWLVDAILEKLPDEQYDIVLVITRGGMVPACLISEKLHLRNIMVAAVQFHTRDGVSLDEPVFWQFPDDDLLRDKAVLIVDDVWDSGRTAVSVRDRVRSVARVGHVAVLHYKPGSSAYPDQQPDFYGEITDDWIIYPWDTTESSRP